MKNEFPVFLKLLYRNFHYIYISTLIILIMTYIIGHIEIFMKIKIDGNFLTSIVFALISTLYLAIPFYVILKKIKIKITFYEVLKMQIVSWGARYLPAKVGPQIVKLNCAKRKNYKITKFSVSVFLDAIFQLFMPLPIILLGTFFVMKDHLLLAVTSASCFTLFLFFFKKFVHFFCIKIFKISDRDFYEVINLFNANSLVYLFGYYFIFSILYGMIFPPIVNMFININISEYFNFIYIFLFSAFVGQLAIFAPLGIGIREGVLVSFLLHYTDMHTAILISIVSRFVIVIIDLLLVFVSFFILQKEKQSLNLKNMKSSMNLN